MRVRPHRKIPTAYNFCTEICDFGAFRYFFLRLHRVDLTSHSWPSGTYLQHAEVIPKVLVKNTFGAQKSPKRNFPIYIHSHANASCVRLELVNWARSWSKSLKKLEVVIRAFSGKHPKNRPRISNYIPEHSGNVKNGQLSMSGSYTRDFRGQARGVLVFEFSGSHT